MARCSWLSVAACLLVVRVACQVRDSAPCPGAATGSVCLPTSAALPTPAAARDRTPPPPLAAGRAGGRALLSPGTPARLRPPAHCEPGAAALCHCLPTQLRHATLPSPPRPVSFACTQCFEEHEKFPDQRLCVFENLLVHNNTLIYLSRDATRLPEASAARRI